MCDVRLRAARLEDDDLFFKRGIRLARLALERHRLSLGAKYRFRGG